jgi:hypothetical protein
MDDKDKPTSAFSALGQYSSNAEKREEAIERAKLSGERRHLTNMPNAFFNQQMQAMMDSMKAISVQEEAKDEKEEAKQVPESSDSWVDVEVELKGTAARLEPTETKECRPQSEHESGRTPDLSEES